jgi:pimeloyl-ACP methyl ester carboxylesterase
MRVDGRAPRKMILIGFFSASVRPMFVARDASPIPVSLKTLQWGRPGNGRALLVHGVQSSANSWWRIADALAHAGLHVTAPDLRGHGHSPSGASYALRDFVADLHGVGDGWDLVAGHSLGGTLVAWMVAADPGFARRAVLLDPVIELPEEDFDAIVAGQLDELATADAAVLQAAHPTWHPEDCRIKAQAATACSPFVNEAVLRDNRPWRYSELLGRVQTPVLVLGADPSAGGMLDPALARRLAARNGQVTYRIVAGSGHSVHRDRPQSVIDALLEAH